MNLLELALTIISAFAYAVIGVTGFHVIAPRIWAKCNGVDHMKNYGSMRRGGVGCSQDSNVLRFGMGMFVWPLLLVLFTCSQVARIPLRTGKWLAQQIERTTTSDTHSSVVALETKISALENELGIGRKDD